MTFPSSLRPKQKPNQGLPSTLKPKPKQESGLQQFQNNVEEIPTQFAKGAVSGGLGSYGNILDILGLQSKDTLPGEESKRYREYEILERMQQGKPTSIGDFEELSDDDVLPRYSRLPTSNETSSFLEELGIPGAKTISGRYAERGGQFVGGGLTLGQTGAGVPLASAAAGQTVEELGGPAWLQAVAEIGTALKLSSSKSPISSSSKNVQSELDRLKKIGFSDEDLTLARNALEDRGFLKKSSKYTRDAEKRFKETNTNIEKNINSIIEESFPGLNKEGPQAFRTAASELYDTLDNMAREVTINKPQPFVRSADRAIKEMERTLAKSPQKQEAIDILTKAKETSGNSPIPADFYTNFYKEMNAIGNWGNPKQRELAFTAVKNAIKDTFYQQGTEGIRLGNALEEANKSWMKYLNAEEVSTLLGKVSTEEGINFKKLANSLQKPDNFEVLKKGIGETQAGNIAKLSDIASTIGDFEKSMKGGLAKDLLSHGTLYGLAKAVLSGDLSSLKTMAGIQVAGTFATKLLTDPSYQNIAIRMARAAKDQQWNIVKSLSQALETKIKKDSTFKNKVNTDNNP